GVIVKNLSLSFAKKETDYAHKWLLMVPEEHMDAQVYNQILRLNIKSGFWQDIIKIYEKSPENLQSKEKWLYWYARAKYNTGATKEAMNILRSISHKRSFYGFLASMRTKQEFNVNYRPLKVADEILLETKQKGCSRRAIELKK